MAGRDIYLTGRDIYFEGGHNFATTYYGDEILIMCTNPEEAFTRANKVPFFSSNFGPVCS